MRSGVGSLVCVLAAMLVLVSPALLLRGQQEAQPVQHLDGGALFRERGCSFCHGADFAGTDKGPSLETVGKRLKRDAIARQIREGGGMMPAFAEVLPEDEIQRLVALLAQKKKVPGRSAHGRESVH